MPPHHHPHPPHCVCDALPPPQTRPSPPPACSCWRRWRVRRTQLILSALLAVAPPLLGTTVGDHLTASVPPPPPYPPSHAYPPRSSTPTLSSLFFYLCPLCPLGRWLLIPALHTRPLAHFPPFCYDCLALCPSFPSELTFISLTQFYALSTLGSLANRQQSEARARNVPQRTRKQKAWPSTLAVRGAQATEW